MKQHTLNDITISSTIWNTIFYYTVIIADDWRFVVLDFFRWARLWYRNMIVQLLSGDLAEPWPSSAAALLLNRVGCHHYYYVVVLMMLILCCSHRRHHHHHHRYWYAVRPISKSQRTLWPLWWKSSRSIHCEQRWMHRDSCASASVTPVHCWHPYVSYLSEFLSASFPTHERDTDRDSVVIPTVVVIRNF